MSSTNSTKIVTLSEYNLSGVLVWSGLLLVIGFFCIIVFEIVRHNSKYFQVYYTRLINPNSPRNHPKKLFEWIYWVFREREDTVLDQVGLDAVMFLRYLQMCFQFFSTIAVVLCIILIPVNSYASSPSDVVNVTVDNGTVYQISDSALSTASISNINDGSNLLWIHAICVWLVSFFLMSTLFENYSKFATLAANQLRQRKKVYEIKQQKTILINNLSSEFDSIQKLESWFNKMNLPVDEVFINTNDDILLIEKVKEYNTILNKLEHAYMQWAVKIYHKLSRNGAAQRLSMFFSPNLKLKLSNTYIEKDQLERALQISPNLRPTTHFLQPTKQLILKRDTISWLTRELHSLKNVIQERRKDIHDAISGPTSFDPLRVLKSLTPTQVKTIYKELRKSSESAFVTFKSNRSAFIASQTLLHPSKDGTMMKVTTAPAPNEVLWSSLTRSYMDRKIFGGVVALISFLICLFWIYPSYAISSLTIIQIQDSKLQDASTNFLIFVNQIVPPVLVFVSAKLAPYLLEFFSYRQYLDSTVQVDASTLSKYFYFLMFNVHFVFSMLTSAFGTSGSFFSNPMAWIESIAVSFPEGASFFMNFVILNIIIFPLELLRPVALVWFLVGKYFCNTPREFKEFADSNSLLNYGFIYPLHILVFIVVLCYSIISPLVMIPGIIYFGFAWLVYKNQLLYVYVKQSEGFGSSWVMAFQRSVIGLGLFQFLTAGLISAKKAPFIALFTGSLIPVTFLFYSYCKSCFDRHEKFIPLGELELEDSTNAESPGGNNLTHVDTSPDHHSIYKPPLLAKSLPEVWIPNYLKPILLELEKETAASCSVDI